MGLSYTFDRQPAQEIVLAEEMERGEKRVITQLLAFEELQAEPDQLLSYYFWRKTQDLMDNHVGQKATCSSRR